MRSAYAARDDRRRDGGALHEWVCGMTVAAAERDAATASHAGAFVCSWSVSWRRGAGEDYGAAVWGWSFLLCESAEGWGGDYWGNGDAGWVRFGGGGVEGGDLMILGLVNDAHE